MTTKREQETRAMLTNLKLQAAIRAGAPTGGDEIFRSNDSGAGDQKLWDSLRAEEAAEQRQAQQNSPYNKTLRAQWRKPLATIMQEKTYSMALFLDPTAELPMSSNPADADFSKAQQVIENDLDDVLETKGIVLSANGKLRTMVYGGMQSDAVTVLNGVEHRGATGTLQYWIACVNRLAELDAYDESEYSALPEAASQPEPVEETADELLELAGSEFSRLWGAVWSQWLVSLKTHFDFVPTEEQKFSALRYFERANMGDPQVWNNCRLALSKSGVFPNLLTREDVLCLKLESRDWDFSRADHRAEFARAKNQTYFDTL